MAKDESVISASGYFDGQTSRGNFDVQLKAKFAPEELANALQFVAGIGKRIQLLAIVENEKVIGVGEIGLDYHYGKEDKILQLD